MSLLVTTVEISID